MRQGGRRGSERPLRAARDDEAVRSCPAAAKRVSSGTRRVTTGSPSGRVSAVSVPRAASVRARSENQLRAPSRGGTTNRPTVFPATSRTPPPSTTAARLPSGSTARSLTGEPRRATVSTRDSRRARRSTSSVAGAGESRAACAASASPSSGSRPSCRIAFASSARAFAASAPRSAAPAFSRASLRCESAHRASAWYRRARRARPSRGAPAAAAGAAPPLARRRARAPSRAPPPGEHGRREHVVEDLVARRPAARPGTRRTMRAASSARARARAQPGPRRRYRARSSTACAIFVPDGVTRWSKRTRDDVAVVGGEAGERPLEVLLDDALGAAELLERREPEHVRAPLPLDVPDPLEHELEVRRLDAALVRRPLDEPSAGQPAARSGPRRPRPARPRRARPPPSPLLRRARRTRASGPSIAERAAARVRWSRRRTLPKSPGRRRLNASSSASASSRTPSRTCTGRSGRVSTSSSSPRERPAVAPVVEHVLLHLVEHEVELLPLGDCPLGECVGERDVVSRARGGRDGRDRIVAPAVDDRDLDAAPRRHPPARASAAARHARRAAVSSCRRRSGRRARSAATP